MYSKDSKLPIFTQWTIVNSQHYEISSYNVIYEYIKLQMTILVDRWTLGDEHSSFLKRIWQISQISQILLKGYFLHEIPKPELKCS